MSIAVLILGESGTGKSTSMRNLKPSDTLLIQAVQKPLPFRSPDWRVATKDGGNIVRTDDSAKIVRTMERAPHPIIVIDDWQYVLANEFMRRTGEKGFDKFTEIGRHAWDIINAAGSLPDHKRVYILAHTQTDEYGGTKVKTIGKLLDEKVCVEGMFSIVLRTLVQDRRYLFATQNNGSDTVKSPMGLFDAEHIDNDLAAVDTAIVDYYGIVQPSNKPQEAA